MVFHRDISLSLSLSQFSAYNFLSQSNSIAWNLQNMFFMFLSVWSGNRSFPIDTKNSAIYLSSIFYSIWFDMDGGSPKLIQSSLYSICNLLFSLSNINTVAFPVSLKCCYSLLWILVRVIELISIISLGHTSPWSSFYLICKSF